MQTVLLLDSCTLTRECLSMILRAKGYRVQSTALISQAKAMIAKRAPDIIVTEIRLPDDNILNLMRTFKDDPNASKIKVCLLTQAAAKKPITEAIELGACTVMLKSKFTVASFIEQVNAVGSATLGNAQSSSTDAEPALAPEIRYPLPMPAKDPALALKEIKPIIARAKLKEGLEEMEELCTLSEPIVKILEAINSPDTDIDDVADLLKLDQTIAMKIMRVANSIEYARGEQTITLKDAIIRIGLEELKNLVTGIGIVDNLAEIKSTGSLNHELFWEHSLAVAVCSSKIASYCPDVGDEVAFTAAILHDIGRVILQQTFPDEYKQVLETADNLGISLELVEKRLLLADHTSIAQTMLHSWNLPKDLVDAIANHHCQPSKLSTSCPKNTRLAAIIELSNRIVHAMGIGSSGNSTISSTEELFTLIDAQKLNIDEITHGLAKQIKEMRSTVYSSDDKNKPTPPNPHAPVFDRAFHPLFISMDTDFDAIEHWVMANADEGTDDTLPNIAIIHARQPKDKQELADKLDEALGKLAFDSSAQAIPVLILSPSGKTALSDELLTRHPSMILMTNFSVLHFEQTVNHLLNGLVRAEEPREMRKAA